MGFFVGKLTKRGFGLGGASDDELDEMREESKEALRERTEERKKRILELMDRETIHEKELGVCSLVDRSPGITCEEVEKLLGVSGGTARKYLNELEDEWKVRPVPK